MNQQQKNYIKSRVKQIVDDARQALKKAEDLDTGDAIDLGLQEKALIWPKNGELKARVLEAMTNGSGNYWDRKEVAGHVFADQWDAWKRELKHREKAAKEAYEAARNQITDMGRGTIDNVMLGDSEEAAKSLADFEEAVNKLVTDFNG